MLQLTRLAELDQNVQSSAPLFLLEDLRITGEGQQQEWLKQHSRSLSC